MFEWMFVLLSGLKIQVTSLIHFCHSLIWWIWSTIRPPQCALCAANQKKHQLTWDVFKFQSMRMAIVAVQVAHLSGYYFNGCVWFLKQPENEEKC